MRIAMRPSAHVLSRQVSDGAVLIHLETNQVYDLNRTGYRIWQLLEAGSDYRAIRNCIEHEFDVNPDVAAKEISALLDHLAAEHLTEEVQNADGSAA